MQDQNFKLGIWKHLKTGNLYRATSVAFSRGTQVEFIVYNRCTEKGTFMSLRKMVNNEEEFTKQPFLRERYEFELKFELIKEADGTY